MPAAAPSGCMRSTGCRRICLKVCPRGRSLAPWRLRAPIAGFAGAGAKRTYAERLTDGDFVASARLGVADEANPSVASDRYYEIDLGAERNVRFVNLLGQAGRRTSWRIYVSPDSDERQWRLWGDFRAQAAEGLSGVWLEGAPQPARFVRIYGMGGDYDASHAGAVVREVTLYE